MEAVICLLFIAANPQDDAIAKEWPLLQGSWKVVTVEVKGKKIAGDDFPIARVNFEIKMPKDVAKGCQVLTISLDPSKSPKTIKGFDATERAKRFSLVGIYEVDGDKLRLCLNEGDKDPPVKFATTAERDTILLELKRVKK